MKESTSRNPNLKPWRPLINEVLRGFNFKKVHKVMTFLGWKWASLDRTPRVAELRQQAREMLETVALDHADSDWCFSETGGFRAERRNDFLFLAFYLDSIMSEERAELQGDFHRERLSL